MGTTWPWLEQARTDGARRDRHGEAGRGGTRPGSARGGRRDVAGRGLARRPWLDRVVGGVTGPGWDRLGTTGRDRRGAAWGGVGGVARTGTAWRDGRGLAGTGLERSGEAR